MNATGFITAGGRSSRMGRDKAWLEIDGRSMIEHVIAALAPVTTGLAIIANSDDYNRLGLPVFRDTNEAVGPLEAIRTSLANSGTERVALAACDMPFVTAELFSLLLDKSHDHQAAVPVGSDDRLEPLCAIYSTDAVAEVTALIESGERKVSRLFDRISTRFVYFDEIGRLPRSDFFFVNINTPEEYARALASMQASGRGGK